jgi:sigma-B regulation protein RsbU (phosphoserine phosphatase)
MEEELRVARSIQEGLVPKSVPTVEGMDLYGFSTPAREVGGDYYDWVPLPGGRIGCVVADVSGKGMPAALLMAQLQAAFKAQAQQGRPPEAVVTSVNQFLSVTMEPARFVTLFYGVFDPGAGTLTYANAGHNPAFLWRRDGTSEWVGEGGLMLSPVSLSPYQAYTIPFQPGDGIVLYTDGVTEAEAAGGAQWEEAHLQRAIMEGPRNSAREVAQRVMSAVTAFVAGNEQSDDMTLAVLVHRG